MSVFPKLYLKNNNKEMTISQIYYFLDNNFFTFLVTEECIKCSFLTGRSFDQIFHITSEHLVINLCRRFHVHFHIWHQRDHKTFDDFIELKKLNIQIPSVGYHQKEIL